MKRDWKARSLLNAGICCAVWLSFAAAAFTGCGNQENSGGTQQGAQSVLDRAEAGSKGAGSETDATPQNSEGEPDQEKTLENQGMQGADGQQGTKDSVQTGDLNELLASWNFDYGHIMLEQVTEELDRNDIPYTGYYNVSQERLDLTVADGVTLLFLETTDPRQQPAGYELVMKEGEFNKNGFQENYLNAYDVITDEYYYPDLSDKVFSENDLLGLNQTDLSILRNQIFARHGRKFQDAFLDAVFRQKSWYQPEYSAEEFAGLEQKTLSGADQENLKTIRKVEEQKGYRKTGKGDYTVLKGLLSGSWIDLDGDGLEEQVLYTRTMEDEDLGSITLLTRESGNGPDNREVSAKLDGIRFHSNCYVFTMDGTKWFLAVASDGMSADFNINVYGYEQGKLSSLGVIPSYVESVKVYADKVLAMVETAHFQCQPLELEYTIENGAVRQIEKDYYEYAQNESEALKEIPLLKDKNGSEIAFTLKPGDEIVVMGGDLSQWVKLKKKSTGEVGWLKAVDMECFFPDGSSELSSLLFDELRFYG